eukprot:gnl/MRDRNA2_/MRDRNA2_125074_c0_seq1.p1 gnl/MRDRNA2_/MRDRNA2_125074_c0~~gnl/MRDRNA2_/MRDRNA2_125074_c0_seq1.p1  ORF type:complete len:642 (-),score=132.12 gnl/MRDRNA2_/MRDRNA2_125074_c0_seq1:89-2014(-)
MLAPLSDDEESPEQQVDSVVREAAEDEATKRAEKNSPRTNPSMFNPARKLSDPKISQQKFEVGRAASTQSGMSSKLNPNETARLMRLNTQHGSMDEILNKKQQEKKAKNAEKSAGYSVLKSVVHSSVFSAVISLVIVANAVQIGFETDYGSEAFDWTTLELVFLGIYWVELLIRFAADRLACFQDSWFLFDMVVIILSSIVTTGLADEMPSGSSVVVLRIARLCKLVRIVRLFRFCNELCLLVSSMTAAMKTVLWMWVLLGLVIYTFSIIFCNELGHQYKDDFSIQEWWGSVIRSCFTLFSVLTLEGWTDIARHIWSLAPPMVVLIILFISLTTYAIVNVVVAIIVQHVVGAAMSRQDDYLKRVEKDLKDRTSSLAEVFYQADVDGSGTLTQEEFADAIQNKNIQRVLANMDLDVSELSTLFEQIDLDGNGSLSIHEFIQGTMQMRGPARARRLFELHCDFSRQSNSITQRMDNFQDVLNTQASCIAKLQATVDSLVARTGPSPSGDERPTSQPAAARPLPPVILCCIPGCMGQDGPIAFSASSIQHALETLGSRFGVELPLNAVHKDRMAETKQSLFKNEGAGAVVQVVEPKQNGMEALSSDAVSCGFSPMSTSEPLHLPPHSSIDQVSFGNDSPTRIQL